MPCEEMYSKIKKVSQTVSTSRFPCMNRGMQCLRRRGATHIAAAADPETAVSEAFETITVKDVRGYIEHAGYNAVT